MKNKIINYCMNIIKSNNNFDDIKLEEIKYGLSCLYLQISKIIIITFIAIILHIFYEYIIFLLIYSVIRATSFGLHATKSWICLLSSTLIFILLPIICKYITLSLNIKVILGIILIILISKNAPADTKKKPIVNMKKRIIYKYLSTFIAIIYIYISIFINDNFLSNCFILSLLLQSFLISPVVYKIFRLPYNNYKMV